MDTSNSPGEGALQSPLVEFVTSTGERVRVSGRLYSASPSARVGDAVTVAYSRSNPRNAQLLLLKEFPLGPAGFVLGLTGFVLLIWIGCILIDPAYPGDPFHLLPAVISHFRLTPRFALFSVLSLCIPACGLGTYVFSRQALDLRSNGIKAVGHVIGFERENSRLNDGSTASGVFPMIAYKDASGTAHTIRRSTAWPLSRLKTGDLVEVIYLARHPDKGIVDTWDDLYLVPLILGSFTLAFLVWFRLVLSGTIRV
jgi:Protein of unknown function (DUF3592)